MRFRTTLMLALVLVLGILGVVYLDKQDQSREELGKESSKILSYSGDQVLGISLLPAGIQAERDGDGWKLLAPVQTGGDKTSLDAIASLFSWAKKERIVSTEAGEYPSFGLLPPRATLILNRAGGNDTLFIGDDSQVGSFVYARKAGSPEVFLTTTSLWSNINKTLFDLRDKNLLVFEQSLTDRLEIKNAQGLFTLSREGEVWQLLSPRECRADSRKVTELLNALQYQKAARFVEEDPRDLESYGLKRPALEVRVGSPASNGLLTLSIGSFKEGSYFARNNVQPPLLAVDSAFVNRLQIGLDELRDKTMLRFNSAAVNAMELTAGDTTYICRKDTAGNWRMHQPVIGAVRSWKMTGLLSDLASAAAEAFAADEPASLRPFGLDQPQLRCRLIEEEGAVAEFLVGRRQDTATLYAMTGGGRTVFMIRNDLFDKLNLRSTDLLESSPADPVASPE